MVAGGIDLERSQLLRVRVEREARPVFRIEARRMLGERRVEGDGLVAGEDAGHQKAVAIRVGGELIVAIEEAVADPLLESLDDVRRLSEHHDAADLDARPERKAHARNDTEQPIPADRQPEQLWMLGARALSDDAVGADEIERFNLA